MPSSESFTFYDVHHQHDKECDCMLAVARGSYPTVGTSRRRRSSLPPGSSQGNASHFLAALTLSAVPCFHDHVIPYTIRRLFRETNYIAFNIAFIFLRIAFISLRTDSRRKGDLDLGSMISLLDYFSKQ